MHKAAHAPCTLAAHARSAAVLQSHPLDALRTNLKHCKFNVFPTFRKMYRIPGNFSPCRTPVKNQQDPGKPSPGSTVASRCKLQSKICTSMTINWPKPMYTSMYNLAQEVRGISGHQGPSGSTEATRRKRSHPEKSIYNLTATLPLLSVTIPLLSCADSIKANWPNRPMLVHPLGHES